MPTGRHVRPVCFWARCGGNAWLENSTRRSAAPTRVQCQPASDRCFRSAGFRSSGCSIRWLRPCLHGKRPASTRRRPPHALPMPGVQIAAVAREISARRVPVMHSSRRVWNPRFVSARTTGTANAIDPMPSRRRSKSRRNTRTRRAQTLLEPTSARFFLRSSAHFALCDAKKRNRGQVVESGENRPERAHDGLLACTARAGPNGGHSATSRTKQLFLRCFLRALRSRAGSKCKSERVRPASNAASPADAMRRHGENNCVRVLTVEKTVIRFRPSRRCLQKRVRRINTKTRSKIQRSARNFFTVDSGVVSPAKTQRQPNTQTRAARRHGFFLAAPPTGDASRIRSGARCASAVGRGSDTHGVVSTGPQYPQVH